MFLPITICQCTDKSLVNSFKSLKVDIKNNFKGFEIREDFSVIQPARPYTRGSEKIPKNVHVFEESSQSYQSMVQAILLHAQQTNPQI